MIKSYEYNLRSTVKESHFVSFIIIAHVSQSSQVFGHFFLYYSGVIPMIPSEIENNMYKRAQKIQARTLYNQIHLC